MEWLNKFWRTSAVFSHILVLIMRKTLGYFLPLLLTTAAALAQDTLTGIQMIGAVSLLRTASKITAGPLGTIDSTMDSFGGGFQRLDYTNYTPPQLSFTTIGPCIVANLGQLPGPTGLVTTPLDAGPAMNVSGPNGSKQFAVIKTPNSIAYGGALGGGIALPFPGAPPVAPLYLDPGTYTVDNGSGGADIGPFTATLTVSGSPFVWTNADADMSIDRSAGVDVQWTGGDPAAKITIAGVSGTTDLATRVTTGASFTCTVDNTGDFVVTSDVLSLLPATPAGATAGAGSTLSVSSGVQASFDAPGSDRSLILFLSGAARTVTYK
jgi:hypothetical protein